jgi:glycosyltransferase involved in cell wall biosynthesis
LPKNASIGWLTGFNQAMNKKRILFTIPNFDTAGSGAAMLKIASRLDKNLFDAHIACFHNNGAFFKEVEASGLPVHFIQYVSPARPLSKLCIRAWKVSRQLKKVNADLIHSYHYGSDYTEALAAKLAGIPWVFTKKNMSWGGHSANGWRLRSRLAIAIAIQNTDMQKDFYPGTSKTYYIPRGVDLAAFDPLIPDKTIREKMGTPAGKRVLICVANMVPVKGIELLIAAFKSICMKTNDWALWLVGDNNNEYAKNLIKLVKEEGFDGVIRFSGKVSNVKAYLDHAEIFVLPTKNEGRKEGSPVALLEAMANAKVVLGSNIPGIKDQLKPFPDSLFHSGNENDLTKKLTTLTQQTREENGEQGQRFRECVQREFPIVLEVERHEQLYKKLLKMNINE